jgi:hypothetical protein
LADSLRFERETITEHGRLSDLLMKISTGDIDFCDVFAPPATRQAMPVDPHEWQERRIFEA